MSQYLIPQDRIMEEMILQDALKNRIITLNTEIDRDSIYKMRYLLERIVRLDKKENIIEPITIRLDSYGGCANSTMHFVSYMKCLQANGYIINTEALGACMSGAFKILIAGNKRSAHKYCDIMVHQPNSFVYDYQSLQDKKIDYEQTLELWELLKDYISEETLITKEQLDMYVDKNRNWHMRPQEALELGVIDEII
jgi:ATP-dependent Clp protease protease subunit